MTQTPNYKLTQWAKTDRIEMEDFNADNAKLDAALKAHDTAIAAKAAQSALSAETSARKSADSAINAALALRGNCQIYCGTYKGSGKGTQAEPRTLTFPYQPRAVFISSDNVQAWLFPGTSGLFLRGGTTLHPSLYMTWSGNSVSFYTMEGDTSSMDNPNVTYSIIALMKMD